MKQEEMDMLKQYKEMLKHELLTDLAKDMDACACDYHRHKMLKSIILTVNGIDEMLENCAKNGDYAGNDNASHELTADMEVAWVNGMMNDNGNYGEHWTIDQTTAVAEQVGVAFDHISKEDWYVAMNAMWSDYEKNLAELGITDASVFAALAKGFLFDDDAVPPKEKLYFYYKYIVKK